MSNDRNASLADGTNSDSITNKAEFADHNLTTPEMGERNTLPFDGPWIVNPFRAQVDSSKVDSHGDLVPVCQMLWPTKLRTEDETGRMATAIAALPELLAAAELARVVLMGVRPGFCMKQDGKVVSAGQALLAITDALESARGEA